MKHINAVRYVFKPFVKLYLLLTKKKSDFVASKNWSNGAVAQTAMAEVLLKTFDLFQVPEIAHFRVREVALAWTL